jgi:hypothetical protein
MQRHEYRASRNLLSVKNMMSLGYLLNRPNTDDRVDALNDEATKQIASTFAAAKNGTAP